MNDRNAKYLLAGIIGAVAGAAVVAIMTRALPSMMARVMRKMMVEMSGEGCNPEKM